MIKCVKHQISIDFLNLSSKSRKFRDTMFLSILLGSILWIFTLPIVLYRLFIHLIALIFRSDLIPICNPIDNYLCVVPTSKNKDVNANLLHCWKLNGKLDTIEFRKYFYNTFLSTDQLRKSYGNLFCSIVKWMGYPFKKQVNSVNLEEHIEQFNWTLMQLENLESFIVKWNNNANDFGDGNPAWKMLIIHVDKSKNGDCDQFESILLFKIDHALMDGYSFTEINDKLTGTKTPYGLLDKSPSFLNKVKFMLASPKLCFDMRQQSKTHKSVPHFSKSEILESSNFHLAFTTLELELVKKLRRATLARFNVILGMLQIGAIRRYLLQRGIFQSEDELPVETYITTPIGLPDHPMKTRGEMGNHFGIAEWKVPIRTTKSGKDRTLEAEEDYSKGHEIGKDRLTSEFITKLVWLAPINIREFFTRSEILSNAVPGANHISSMLFSSEHSQILGNPVQSIHATLNFQYLFPWLKMFVGAVTFGDKIHLSVSSTSDVFKSQSDIDWFTHVLIKEELDHLLDSL